MNTLRRTLIALPLALTLFGAHALFAQDHDKKPDDTKQKDDDKQPTPPEKSSVTHHDLTLNGKVLHYTATAGTLLIHQDEDDKPYGSIFYVAYTLDNAEPRSRPVSFLYNGGPGSASLWLHMGSFGPVRVVTSSPAASGPAPYQTVPNEYSLLDKTDLVFIDAPLTGFSRVAGKATPKDFAGVDEDIKAFDKFIVRYVTVNQRWNSPKFLIGESYGTTRSAALAPALEASGISLNGIVLVSSILNYGELSPGTDTPYINNLPSYAAIAWYHNKLQNKPADLKPFLDEVRTFAHGPYSEALSQGDALPAAQADAIAQKVSQYTGLSVQYVKEANLRVSPFRFRKELLRDNREIVGRYDARFAGTDIDAAGEMPGYDPSDTGIEGAFISAFHDYLARELKYDTQDTYKVSADTIQTWNWKHRAAGGGGPGRGEQQMPYVAGDLADAIRKNPRLHVFSANGYFDLATPFFATEYDLSHMNLEPSLVGNVQFGYYPSGHMIYLNVDALKQLHGDLENFFSTLLK